MVPTSQIIGMRASVIIVGAPNLMLLEAASSFEEELDSGWLSLSVPSAVIIAKIC